MSTKMTLADADTFHFYQEVLDEHYVYLELQGESFRKQAALQHSSSRGFKQPK